MNQTMRRSVKIDLCFDATQMVRIIYYKRDAKIEEKKCFGIPIGTSNFYTIRENC